MPATFRIYSASAGSGKTYQLTKEYLRLALGANEAGYYKSILAITFTNAAAAEMKERIIGALRGFSNPGVDAKADALLAELAEELYADGLLPRTLDTPEQRQQQLRRRAQQTFKLVLYHYADFAVSTIDSFVQRVVQAFTRELGLPAAFEVELDDESVLHAAVALLLDKVNRGEEHALLTRTLQDYALSKAEEGRSWNQLPDEMMRFGKFLLNESVHEAVAQLQQMELKEFRTLHKTLKQRREQMQADMQALGDRAVEALAQHGLVPDQLAGGSRGVHAHFTKPLRWLEDPVGTPTSTARKAADSGKWGSADAMKGPLKPALEAVAGELTEVFQELEQRRDQYLSQYLLIEGMLPQLFHVSLLSELSKAVQQVSQDRNVVLIGEFNRRLAQIVLREPVPFLYERLGEKYQHLLIDEFQDTSELQWNNLLPLVENAVAGGNLSLAVGDAKQAIYRWRGGEMEQILRLYQGHTLPLINRAQDEETRDILEARYIGLEGALEPASLQTNYRSGPQIIQFNNDFFTHVSQSHPQLELVQQIYDAEFVQNAPKASPPSPLSRGEGEPDDSGQLPGAASPALSSPDSDEYSSATSTVGQFVLTADARAWEKTSDFAKEMRRHPTPAEEVLWQELRDGKLGSKFRRQHVIGTFIVDFVCIPGLLVVEIDGEVHGDHEQAEYDAGRTHELEGLGYRIVRFTNHQVLHQLPNVLDTLHQALNQPNPTESDVHGGAAQRERSSSAPSARPSSDSPLSAGEGGRGGEAHVEILLTQPDAPARRYLPAEGRYTDEPLPGHTGAESLDYDESTLYLTLALVEQALADGFRLEDVAVLCRRRDQSRRVAKFLKERGYDIISADSLSLEFAEVVNLLVAILRVLHQPANSLARVEALLLVDKVVRGVPPTPTRARRIGEIAKEERSKPFFDELRRLGYDVQEKQTGNLDLYELSEKLMGLFGLLHRREESEYLFRFLDLTLEYSLRFGNNLGNFLAYWDQRKSNLSINAPAGRGGAVTITTVHKAKGLAYGVVIVPWADWSLEPSSAFGGSYLWGRLEADDKPVAEMPPVAVVKQRKELAQTVLADQYAEEREKTFVEALNLLYVAFTRPRHRLYIITRRPDAGKSGKDETAPATNIAQLLQRYLLNLGQWNEEQLTYVLSQGASAAAQTNPPQPAASNQFALTNLNTADWEQRLRLRRHASTVFDFSEQQQQREWSRKLHFALRRVIMTPDVERVAGQLTAEGLVSRREQPELLQRLRQVVQHPQLTPYFQPGVIAETEREILVGGAPREDYKPDRVVFEPRLGEGRGRVTLLDFRVPPPEDRHQQLVRQYGQLFKRLGFADVRGLLYYFETEEVVEFSC
ncbi:UvrD-helicase domain-containing protein [Hymenobacter sp. BT18]|uniref:UvrD-helicase domain-containing protein n=1 Tax=Hymenobacter sp. BT18 TaxID=2835648 RepID=UPI00143E9AE6|nr:UvrD-helicase domain-containing protein [Hymenobacter sp. BT18]QIX60021.1 UvrD-helicase domain-containing protein [Hymenobacter sp. BT18]